MSISRKTVSVPTASTAHALVNKLNAQHIAGHLFSLSITSESHSSRHDLLMYDVLVKSTFIKNPFPCTFLLSSVLVTKDEPKKNLG